MKAVHFASPVIRVLCHSRAGCFSAGSVAGRAYGERAVAVYQQLRWCRRPAHASSCLAHPVSYSPISSRRH